MNFRRAILIVNKTPLRHVMKAGFKVIKYPLLSKRKSIVSKITLNPREVQAAQELERYGSAMVTDMLQPELLKELQNYSEEKLSKAKEIAQAQLRNNKKFWIRLSDDDFKNLDDSNPLVKNALHESVLRILSQYLGQAPYLHYVLLTLSQPSENPYEVSQLWHYDRDDVEMAKFFIYLTDVESEDDGPFTFLNAEDSQPIVTGPGFSHLRDEKVFKRIETKKIKRMIAPKLTAFIVDTTRCLHMGSRLKEGHHRLMFTATFMSLPSVHPWAEKNNIQIQSSALNPLQRAALDANIGSF